MLLLRGFKKRTGTGIADVTKRYQRPPWPFLDLFTSRTKITGKSPSRNAVTDLKIQKFEQEKKEYKNRRRRNLNLIFCAENSGISNLNLIFFTQINYLLLFLLAICDSRVAVSCDFSLFLLAVCDLRFCCVFFFFFCVNNTRMRSFTLHSITIN